MHASRWLRSLQHVAVLFMLLACKPACCAARSTTRLHWRLTTACLEDAPVRCISTSGRGWLQNCIPRRLHLRHRYPCTEHVTDS